jgi:hypothetical protein
LEVPATISFGLVKVPTTWRAGKVTTLCPTTWPAHIPQNNFSGGPGNDVIDVPQDRPARDRVVCGSGFDWVAADKKDVVAPDCEKVVVFRGGTPKDFEAFYNYFYDVVVPDNFYEGLRQQCLPDISELVAAKSTPTRVGV